MITLLVVLSVVAIAALVAVLAVYLFAVGTGLSRIADNLKEADDFIARIVGHGVLIGPGVQHINRSATEVAGALPLIYGLAEKIIEKVAAAPPPPGSGEEHRTDSSDMHVPTGLRRSGQ